MSRIYIYTDLTTSRPWNFHTIHANKDLLSKHGIELGPFNPWLPEFIPSHQTFFTPLDNIHHLSLFRKNMLEETNELLESERDVLMFSVSLNQKSHNTLYLLLKKYIDTNKHEIKSLFTITYPLLIFEQIWRSNVNIVQDDKVLIFIKQYTHIYSIIIQAVKEYGIDNVKLLPDLSDSPVAKPSPDIIQKVFSWLGCPEPQLPKKLPRHPLFLSSHEARRVTWALDVRDNGWPPLDESSFMDCLRSVEQDWSSDPVCPRKYRQMLIQEGADDRRRLEEMLGLKKGDLDGPDWLAQQPELQFDAPLSEDKLKTFVNALPDDVRSPLRQRLVNDFHLLSADQKALAKALKVPSPVTSIGEPSPPVELTVLTSTYNHEAYIAQCMDSVLAQKTEFPVRHLVLDHNSTDGTAGIIAEYASKHSSIQPLLLSFRRPQEHILGLFLRCHTKYAALCDGDDYFTDPLKLQKQVEFLENKPRCALCFHPVAVVYEDERFPTTYYPPLDMLPRGIREEYFLADMFQGNLIQTNSAVYRWRFRDGLPDWFRADLCPADWYWHLLHAEQGRIGFLRDVMSVYRRHSNAWYYSTSISSLEHRRIHGMKELETYQAVNIHFQNRYFRLLSNLANGVLANFLRISFDEGDESLLEQACQKFPEFASEFLKTIKIMRKNPHQKLA